MKIKILASPMIRGEVSNKWTFGASTKRAHIFFKRICGKKNLPWCIGTKKAERGLTPGYDLAWNSTCVLLYAHVYMVYVNMLCWVHTLSYFLWI